MTLCTLTNFLSWDSHITTMINAQRNFTCWPTRFQNHANHVPNNLTFLPWVDQDAITRVLDTTDRFLDHQLVMTRKTLIRVHCVEIPAPWLMRLLSCNTDTRTFTHTAFTPYITATQHPPRDTRFTTEVPSRDPSPRSMVYDFEKLVSCSSVILTSQDCSYLNWYLVHQ